MTSFIVVSRQLIRYVAAGGIAFVVDLAILVVAVQQFHLHYLTGATLGFLVGSIVCYVLSLRWAFDEHRFDHRGLEIAIFIAIGVVGLTMNNLVMWGLVEFGYVNYAASKFVAAGIVLLFNFAARKVVVFTEAAPGPSHTPARPPGPAHGRTVAR